MLHYRSDKSLGVKFHRDLANKGRSKHIRSVSGTGQDRHKRTRKGFWRDKFIEFCKRTDLHGYKYIVMEDLNNVERSCWAVAIIISIIFAFYFVVTAYKWYARNSIVTVSRVIESTQGAIWDIPFPAVTICDLNAISRKAARIFADNMTLPQNITADFVFEAVRFAPLLHSTYITTPEQKDKLRMLQQVLDLNKVSMETLFRTLSPAASCSQLVQRCMWKNTIYRCDQLFQQVFTMYKMCCAFNYYAVPPPVSKTGNMEDQMFLLSSPRRVASCGYQTALTVLLNTNLNDYYSAMVASQGALVFIDSAYNTPNQDSPVRMVNPSTEVLIALSPERTYSTSGIKSFTPEERQCYYSNEIKLGEYRQYSLHNCIEYQRMEIIRRLCECVPFFATVTDGPRICNFNDVECLEMALRPSSEEQVSRLDKEEMITCLPECEHYDYPIEVAMGRLAKTVKLSGLPFFNNVNLVNRSLLNVFFNDLVSTRFRRDVYFNWQNFLAAFGGLLSLMLGFTLISGFDLILFFTLRLAYNSLPNQSDNEQKSNKMDNENDKKVNNWIEKSKHDQKLAEKGLGSWHPKNNLFPKY